MALFSPSQRQMGPIETVRIFVFAIAHFFYTHRFDTKNTHVLTQKFSTRKFRHFISPWVFVDLYKLLFIDHSCKQTEKQSWATGDDSSRAVPTRMVAMTHRAVNLKVKVNPRANLTPTMAFCFGSFLICNPFHCFLPFVVGGLGCSQREHY